MTQIAIQSNTLWFLTAGFATPLLSSMTADRVNACCKKSSLFEEAKAARSTAQARLEGINDENAFSLKSLMSKMQKTKKDVLNAARTKNEAFKAQDLDVRFNDILTNNSKRTE
ncbi:MAG: hypothetical protein MZV70_11370 [Desulfobacterales bacterium]|nr:hypothetical protein [Desulfobacterales bacterium]